MPPKSEAQRGAMHAAKAGKGKLGIPKKVGADFAAADPGGSLPKRKGKPPRGLRQMVKERGGY